MWISQDVDVHLGPLIERVVGALDRLVDLQKAAAKERARPVLARLRLRYPEVSIHVVATSVPENRRLTNFFEVEDTALMVATGCEPERVGTFVSCVWRWAMSTLLQFLFFNFCSLNSWLMPLGKVLTD